MRFYKFQKKQPVVKPQSETEIIWAKKDAPLWMEYIRMIEDVSELGSPKYLFWKPVNSIDKPTKFLGPLIFRHIQHINSNVTHRLTSLWWSTCNGNVIWTPASAVLRILLKQFQNNNTRYVQMPQRISWHPKETGSWGDARSKSGAFHVYKLKIMSLKSAKCNYQGYRYVIITSCYWIFIDGLCLQRVLIIFIKRIYHTTHEETSWILLDCRTKG